MAAGLLLLAIATLHGAAPSAESGPVPVRVTGQAQLCRVEAGGATFELPGDGERMEAAFRAIAARGAVVDFVHIDETIAYECIGHVLLLTQRAGLRFNRIGFISEPPRER
jgi:hypothetical protein